MMWVIRAGRDSLYYNKYLETSKVYIPWDGYKLDFSGIDSRADFRKIVKKEKGVENRTSVSNWAGQLYSFSCEMKIGDCVLIPSKGSRTYCLATITGKYTYDINEKDRLYHSRQVEIKEENIPRDIFSQPIVYSLGAFRTIFKAKHEEEIMKTIIRWKGDR